jgi:predicted amidohydrolase YtcJ
VNEQAELVLRNGTVRTMDGTSTAQGLAVNGGRVTRIGTDREVSELIGADTHVHDLAGGTALPGFIETHSHPVFYGMTLQAAVDAGSPPNDSITDIVDRVAQAVRDSEPGRWLRGYRYDDTLLTDDRHPTRHDLDPASPDNPVCLMHISGHFCVLNSAGLRAVGIDATSTDPEGGVIVRDQAGQPTGVLAETAAFAAYETMPVAAPEELAQALDLAMDSYLANGVTTVHDLGLGLLAGESELTAYHSALGARPVLPRVRAYLVDGLVGNHSVALPTDSDRFRTIGAKLWADGSIQGLTGSLNEGYACAPDQVGLLLHRPEDLAQRVGELAELGLQVAVHGNGDRAIQVIIDAYQRLGVTCDGDLRPRLEHCQMASTAQLDQLVGLGGYASFFIKHVYYWGDRHRDRFLGPERASRLSPLDEAAARGMQFGLHSDTPIVPVSPIEGIWCACNRITRDGRVLGPEHRVDPETAVRGYTSQAAHLSHDEATLGRLRVGRPADIVVLDRDPFGIETEQLNQIGVEATYVDGRLAYAAAQ